MINIGVELPGGLPYQPWLAALVKERWAKNAVDDPHVRCFPDNFLRAYGTPHLLKFAQMPGLRSSSMNGTPDIGRFTPTGVRCPRTQTPP